MNYENFINDIKMEIQEKMGDGVQIELHQVIKNNGVKKDALTIIEKGGNISPTIYLSEYYQLYQEGVTISAIVEDIIKIYTQNKNIHLDTECFKDFEQIRGHVVCKLINFKKNKDLLEKIPHKLYLDLAVVFYYIMKNDAIGNGSILIYNNHLKTWGISKEELYKTARKNTPVLLPYEFRSMWKVLQEVSDEIRMGVQSDDNLMHVLSSQDNNMGAIYISYDTILHEIGNILKENYYILPSSIHECIILSACAEEPKEELVAMVREINATQVRPEEILSDNIYFYDRDRKEVTII